MVFAGQPARIITPSKVVTTPARTMKILWPSGR